MIEDIEAWVALAEQLATEPYPQRRQRRDNGFSEPGLHVVDLMESRDFWDDDAYEAMEPTLLEFRGMRNRLAAALTVRWGTPDHVDLSEVLDRVLDGEQAPLVLEHLSNSSSGPAPLWRRGDRILTVAVCWEDKELPMFLTLAAGQS